MSHGLKRTVKPAALVLALGALAWGAAVLTQSSETMIRSSFARAIASDNAVASLETAPTPPISGSEEFWLMAMGRDASGPKGVSLGDRVTFTLDGKERHYRVVSVSDVAPAATQIDTRTRTERLVLVTARDTADPFARPIRFVIELEGPAPRIMADRPARAL